MVKKFILIFLIKMEGKLSNENFKSKDVGRGIWHLYHSVSFAATNLDDLLSLYAVILIYNSHIRCEICRKHSTLYIESTSAQIKEIFLSDLTYSEINLYFNRWLYNYHNLANENADKDYSTFPSYEEVADYYLNYQICSKDCDK